MGVVYGRGRYTSHRVSLSLSTRMEVAKEFVRTAHAASSCARTKVLKDLLVVVKEKRDGGLVVYITPIPSATSRGGKVVNVHT